MQIGDLVFYRHDGRTTTTIGIVTAIRTVDPHTLYFVRYPSGDGFDTWHHWTRLEPLCR